MKGSSSGSGRFRILCGAALTLALTAFAVRTLAQTTIFPANTTLPVSIPDNIPSGVDVTFPVTGLTGPVDAVALNITFGPSSPGHTWVGDLDIILTAPSGESHVIMENTGGPGLGDSSDITGPYTFADGGSNWWAAASAAGGLIAAGTYSASNVTGVLTSLDAEFAGIAGNGTWTLNVSDNAFVDTGGVSAASLTINDDCANLTLSDKTLMVLEMHAACGVITVGPNYAVMGPNGFLVVTSGTSIAFVNGFEVGVDGGLEAGIDPALNPLFLARQALVLAAPPPQPAGPESDQSNPQKVEKGSD